MIASPPKLYLDTNHLVNIARIQNNESLGSAEKYRENYVFIKRCMREGLCTIIFNFYAPLEWGEGKATEETVTQIADIFDQSKCIYQLEEDTNIYISEIMKHSKNLYPLICFPDIPIMHYLKKGGSYTPAITIIAKNVSDYNFGQVDGNRFPDDVPVVTIREHVIKSLQWREENPMLLQERISGFKAAFEQTKKQVGKNFTRLTKPEIIDWMKRFLQIDKVLRAAKLKTDVEGLLDCIDIAKCPAVNLYVKIRESLIKNKYGPEDNDCDDFAYLPVIPYADISLIEKRLMGQILKANKQFKTTVFCKPSDAENTIRKILNLDNKSRFESYYSTSFIS